MRLLHHLHRVANWSTLRLARCFRRGWLPSFLNHQWIKIALPCWPGLRHRYEPYIAEELRKRLRPGSTFFDLGAHFGLWSLFAAKMVGPTGKVISCEACPSIFQKLTLSTAYYPWIRAFNYGVGATKGELEFYEQGLSTSGSFALEVTEINTNWNVGVPITKVPVQIRPVDFLVTEFATDPTVIKVDVEGYELEVLRGGIDTLSRHVATWIIEVHPPQLRMFGGTEDELMVLFSKYRYHITIIDRNPNSVYVLVAEPIDQNELKGAP